MTDTANPIRSYERESVARLALQDPEAAAAIAREIDRQQDTIELIASENYVSQAVLDAQGSILTNKYAEGYPGRRYYGGCEFVDEVESLAIARAKAMFGADHANVQPHSGSQANAAAYLALLNHGDTVLSMSLAEGGHLTHGHKLSFSGIEYQFSHYGVTRDTETIDYDALAEQAMELKPRLILAGASTYSRIIDFARLREIADQAGSYLMVDVAHIAGLIVAGVHPSPVPYADIVTSTTHKTLRGPRGGLILCKQEHAKAVDRAVFPGIQGGPLEHIIAAKAVAFGEALRPEFADYQRAIVENAQTLAAELQRLGMRLVSGGTDNHLMMVDVLSSYGITGRDAQEALEEAGLACNKNQIPFDTKSPMVSSGIRLGTPAVTTRGFRAPQMKQVARWIAEVLQHKDDPAVIKSVRQETRALCRAFPLE
ncbi:MAG: serine hydroxymethyltransferase [Anaerolineae bacterium]|jgi:glycine hydroxymethyltransferase|nr:serine hydroxymethyltransferase [Chloroflexota bacterium]